MTLDPRNNYINIDEAVLKTSNSNDFAESYLDTFCVLSTVASQHK